MCWRRGLRASLWIVLMLGLVGLGAPVVEAFGPYQTLYVGHLDYGTGRSWEFTYTYRDDITTHAFSFDANAGDVLSIDVRWVANMPEMYLDHVTGYWWQNQPEMVVIKRAPPVGPNQVFTWDWDADFGAGKFLPAGSVRAGPYRRPGAISFTCACIPTTKRTAVFTVSRLCRAAVTHPPRPRRSRLPRLRFRIRLRAGRASSPNKRVAIVTSTARSPAIPIGRRIPSRRTPAIWCRSWRGRARTPPPTN